MIIGNVLSLMLISIVFCLHNPSYFTLVSIYFLLGLTTSIQVISYPIITESNDHMVAGIALSFASIIIMGGGGIAQNLFGFMMEINWQSIWSNIPFSNYQVAFLLIPIAFSLSLLLSFYVKETFTPLKQLDKK